MPVAAARPCRHQSCGRLVKDGSGYCAEHQSDRKIGKFADPHRGSRHARGYGTDWDKKRIRILRRDNGLCQPCLRAGRITAAKQVDHIVPKEEEGTDDDQNLQAICKDCHDAKTAEEARRGRQRRGV